VTLDRRTFLTLAAGGVAAAALAACGASDGSAGTAAPSSADPSSPAAGETTTVGEATTAGPTPTDGAPTPTTTGSTTSESSSSPTTSATSGTWVVAGPGDRDQVGLTFHTDGPTSMVEAVLDIIEGRGLVITTFIVGSWLDANPAMGSRIVAGGHDLANHTYTHPGFETLTPAQMQTEIGRCRTALEAHAGSPGLWFRPSGTDNGVDSPSAATLAAAGAAGYTAIGYDVDPIDYRDPGSGAVTERTLAAVRRGSIVSLHMGHQGTIDALPALLDGLDGKGLEPVSLRTLLG
jgi:peptidoglycan/xylan/chitin deacetylase (PgdA/CDA1 family)